jgi:hypothetical protein
MFQGLGSSCLGENQVMWDFEKLVYRKRGGTEYHFDEKKLGYLGKCCKNLEKIKWEPGETSLPNLPPPQSLPPILSLKELIPSHTIDDLIHLSHWLHPSAGSLVRLSAI